MNTYRSRCRAGSSATGIWAGDSFTFVSDEIASNRISNTIRKWAAEHSIAPHTRDRQS